MDRLEAIVEFELLIAGIGVGGQPRYGTSSGHCVVYKQRVDAGTIADDNALVEFGNATVQPEQILVGAGRCWFRRRAGCARR